MEDSLIIELSIVISILVFTSLIGFFIGMVSYKSKITYLKNSLDTCYRSNERLQRVIKDMNTEHSLEMKSLKIKYDSEKNISN